ncbi:MAG: DegT/DnrJ/EryC1/StrS family aminotransferase, partial [Pirellulaceae bacterium]
GFGDGGALFTDDDDMAERFRQIRVHGQAHKHHHPVLGLNGRLDTLQAAMLLAVFEIFSEEVAQRQAIGARYNEMLAKAGPQGIQLPHIAEGSTSVHAIYTILTPQRDALQARLKEAGIPSVAYYAVPLHLQPVFSYLNYQKGDFPVAEQVAAQCLSLPMSAYLDKEDQKAIVKAIIS